MPIKNTDRERLNALRNLDDKEQYDREYERIFGRSGPKINKTDEKPIRKKQGRGNINIHAKKEEDYITKLFGTIGCMEETNQCSKQGDNVEVKKEISADDFPCSGRA